MHTRARQVLLGALASVVVIGNADNLKEKMKKQGKVGPCIVSPQLLPPKPHEAFPHACVLARGCSWLFELLAATKPHTHTHTPTYSDTAVFRTAGQAGRQACMHLFLRYRGTAMTPCACTLPAQVVGKEKLDAKMAKAGVGDNKLAKRLTATRKRAEKSWLVVRLWKNPVNKWGACRCDHAPCIRGVVGEGVLHALCQPRWPVYM